MSNSIVQIWDRVSMGEDNNKALISLKATLLSTRTCSDSSMAAAGSPTVAVAVVV